MRSQLGRAHSVHGADRTSDWSSVRKQTLFHPLRVSLPSGGGAGLAGHSPGAPHVGKEPCV